MKCVILLGETEGHCSNLVDKDGSNDKPITNSSHQSGHHQHQ